MKHLALLCVVLLAVAPALGQGIGPSVGFGVHGTYANVSFEGPMKDAYGPGYGGGAHLDVNLAMLSIRLNGDYLIYSPDADKVRSMAAGFLGTGANNLAIDGGKVRMWGVNANLKWTVVPLPIVKPYVTGGGGFGSFTMDDATVTLNGTPVGKFTGGSTDTKGSVNVGAGVDLNVGLTLFAEVRYTWLFTEGTTSTYLPVTIGITF